LINDGFPNDLKDDVSKVVGIVPLKTYSNINIGISKQNIKYY